MKDFILPDIGEGIVECEIVEWRIKEGEKVKEDQPICDVMTDKALVEIPSIHNGTIAKLYYKKGDTAKVHQPLFAIDIFEDTSDAPKKTVINDSLLNKKNAQENNKKEQKTFDNNLSKKDSIASANNMPDENNNHNLDIPVFFPLHNRDETHVITSPAVRRLARELNINLQKIQGSGDRQRVYKEDVYAFLKQHTELFSKKISTKNECSKYNSNDDNILVEPISNVMAIMAKHMAYAASTIPHFSFSDEIDVTKLVILKNQLKQTFVDSEVKLTLMPFFIKALSLALNKFPQINVQTDHECKNLYYHKDHNIGFAVNAKTGLIVPNIKQCQFKSVTDIAKEMTEIIETCREGRINPNFLKNGTITVSNIGAIGGTSASPIINSPEAAIVALGKINKLPRFNENNQVCAKDILCVSWSADHRIIDGATIALFNNYWKKYLENPEFMLLDLS